MVKTKFKKAVSLMLAAVMSLTAFMGIGATTAFAAVGEKADVYLVDYPRSGDTNNNGEYSALPRICPLQRKKSKTSMREIRTMRPVPNISRVSSITTTPGLP